MPVPPKLPNELVDAIIFSVAETGRLSPEDRQTLRNCTLVCRDWLPASRHVLFSDVALTTPAAWDSFVRWVVNAEEGRPWLPSIHRLQFTDRPYHSLRGDSKEITAALVSAWRGQYVVPVLAGRLHNLEFLSLSVHWDRCPPHPKTFGMFSQFTSLRELKLFMCFFPSFCAFRRVLVSLPALKSLICRQVEWPIPTQPSILSVRSTGQPALQTLRISFLLPTPMLALLEWLVHTPTRSTLVDLELDYPFMASHPHLQTTLPGSPTVDDFAQILAPSIRRASLGGTQRMKDITFKISLSGFVNLRFLSFEVDETNWPGVADFLRPLPARLDTLVLDVFYRDVVMDSDQVVKEDGDSRKASMTTNGLELLDSVLSRDNFKDMRLLTFKLWGYWDTLLSRLREGTLEEVQRKLPTLHSRATLNIQVDLFDSFGPPPPSLKRPVCG